MRYIYNVVLFKLLVFSFFLAFQFHFQFIEASEMNEGTLGLSFVSRSLSLVNVAELATEIPSRDILGHKITLRSHWLKIFEDHDLKIGLSYYRVSDADENIFKQLLVLTDNENGYKRSQASVDLKYRGTYEFSEKFKAVFGVLKFMRLKLRKDNLKTVLSSRVLNISSESAALVQVDPYLGVLMKAWSGASIKTAIAWRQYLFQSSALDTPDALKALILADRIEVPVKGGHSVVASLKYHQDLLGFLKIKAWTQYDRTIVARSASFSPSLNESYEDVKGHKLNLGGSVSYHLSDSFSFKIWGSYDLLGEIEFVIRKKDAETQKDVDTDFKVEDKSLSGGINLVYGF